MFTGTMVVCVPYARETATLSDSAQIQLALERLAPRLGAGSAGIENLQRLTGGASLQTWRFTLLGDAPRLLILRRRAAPGDNALSLETEAALLRLAGPQGVPVPGVVHVCTPADGLGEAVIVCHVAGETLGRRIVAGEAFAGVRPSLARQAGAALACIHAIDLAGGPDLPVLDAAATLAGYAAIFRRIGACRPVLEVAFRLLARDVPPPVQATLVHGDFRTGNLMVDPQTGLVAVLDWELSHRGDPAEDFGWLCVNSWRFGAIECEAGGFGALEDLRAGYAAVAGEAPPVARIRYWQMLGSLKWAVMCLMMYETHASGADPSLERAAIGRRVSECEADLLALIGAVT
jgi:aminoglycoside phosphotransferase (APT) family kinase protein